MKVLIMSLIYTTTNVLESIYHEGWYFDFSHKSRILASRVLNHVGLAKYLSIYTSIIFRPLNSVTNGFKFGFFS